MLDSDSLGRGRLAGDKSNVVVLKTFKLIQSVGDRLQTIHIKQTSYTDRCHYDL